jgi:hypothetical protein
MMAYGPMAKSVFYYGKWFYRGGNCPLFASRCTQLQYVGCTLNNYDKVSNDTNPGTANYIRLGEIGLSAVIFLGGFLTLVVGLIACCAIIFGTWTAISWLRKPPGTIRKRKAQTTGTQHFTCPNQAIDLTDKKGMAGWFAISILAILFFAAVAVPTHYFQQTEPKAVYIIDSHGTLGKVVDQPYPEYTGGNDTRWSDCFEVRPPADKWGFWGVWWDEWKKKPETVLGLV